MLVKKRIIPKVLIDFDSTKWCAVLTKRFSERRKIGTPVSLSRIYQSQCADELMIVNISNINESFDSVFPILNQMASELLIPITFGGHIRSLDEMDSLFRNGADKLSLSTICFEKPSIVKSAIKVHGAANISACIDYRGSDGQVYIDQNRKSVNLSLMDAVSHVLDLGVGEVLIENIEKDGQKTGFDLTKLVKLVDSPVPLLLGCGCGNTEDFANALKLENVDGVVSGTFFAKNDQSIQQVHNQLLNYGLNVREI